MKILVFTGGLGNQLFGYAFYLSIQKRFPRQKVYGLYSKHFLKDHNGLEINKWFDATLPKQHWYLSPIIYGLYLLKRLFGYDKYLDFGQHDIEKEQAIGYWAFHLDKQYIPDGEWIRFKIDDTKLSERNQQIIAQMKCTNSVFIHARRGDYQSETYKKLFDGTCSLDYYRKAVTYINANMDHPHYFIFSDDMTWVKENIPLTDATYIDWNTGADSPLDMYLMTLCKAGITANSTFSYFGAMLNIKKQIVCCPKMWYSAAYDDPDVYPDEWIKL